jgi:hypothetical protein
LTGVDEIVGAAAKPFSQSRDKAPNVTGATLPMQEAD